MQIAWQSPAEAMVALDTSMGGLSSGEAARRRIEFGPNCIEAVARSPWWLNLLGEFTHFFALILWTAAILAFVADFVEPGQGMLGLGLAIVGVILINGGFSFWQTYRAEQALAALEKLLPQQVNVRRDGREFEIAADQLVPGDLLLLVEGVKVPADCRLIESWGLRVNLSTLTGETYPKARNEAPDDAGVTDPLAAHCLLLAGTLIVSGEGSAVVYAT